jgi:predicted enzyme related to lactoylglutathione lyase
MNKLTHFAIYTDDIDRAARFYQAVFNWQTNGYGQPGFMQIKHTDDLQRPIGALQSRTYAPVPDRINGFECSIEVADINETVKSVELAGGKIVMDVTEIPYVGKIIKFLDTEGNLLCAVQYAPHS